MYTYTRYGVKIVCPTVPRRWPPVSTLAPRGKPARMVDFQKRDTRRGFVGGKTDEDESAVEDDGSESVDETRHEHDVHDLEAVGVAILTVSTSRTLEDDPSGDAIAAAVTEAGHEVITRELVGDALDSVQAAVNHLVARADVDVVVSTGGTGVSPDDVTVEAIDPLLEKDLPGFGEVFRRKSEADIGMRVVGTRATAGIVDSVPVFALPGSVDAVQLGIEEVILPVIGHLTGLAQRGQHDHEDDHHDGK